MNNSSYDEIQYESKPHYPMHADCLGTLGHLFGMRTAPAGKCRVLELGCATAMNIICMADGLPESEFVGIDLSPSQIEAGQQLVDAAGLKNVRLHTASIMDLDESWGEFDYILAHGVFSWVPDFVQEGVFALCRRLLKPHGIAYISYNTYPGWHQRAVARELMQYHCTGIDDPQLKTQQARAILSFMVKSAPFPNSPHARVLAEEADTLERAPDSYVFHEHLEDSNTPLYFHQFMQRAGEHELQYLGEAWQHMQLDDLPAEVSESLQGISHDLIQLEQYADFLTNRIFRRTLLCRDDVELDRSPSADVIGSLLASALGQPASPEPDVRTAKEEKFKLHDGVVVHLTFPIVKAALVHLFKCWPQMVPFDELFAVSLAAIEDPAADREQQRALLAAMLLRGHLTHFVALHRQPFAFSLEVSERPKTSQLVRVLAAQWAMVPSRRHKLVPVPLAERLLLTLLDGTRDLPTLARDFAAARADNVSASGDADSRVADLLVDSDELPAWIETTLKQFAWQALLIA
ncbi:hypothetical protein ETAA8_03420 [Anatilimnocola aggregata]|uniref:Methyltransferase n=1 Tax=Anatilimnocola aggregata TaxID=2528021 RepID=A0A517Y4V0_9BACT|nr:class I SAM-dependent methyltransferase [Anatilimnocola aggregata]QDU25278.1 hypothetical protein ETAA8_03420 [Anatilimnocola aggregata]